MNKTHIKILVSVVVVVALGVAGYLGLKHGGGSETKAGLVTGSPTTTVSTPGAELPGWKLAQTSNTERLPGFSFLYPKDFVADKSFTDSTRIMLSSPGESGHSKSITFDQSLFCYFSRCLYPTLDKITGGQLAWDYLGVITGCYEGGGECPDRSAYRAFGGDGHAIHATFVGLSREEEHAILKSFRFVSDGYNQNIATVYWRKYENNALGVSFSWPLSWVILSTKKNLSTDEPLELQFGYKDTNAPVAIFRVFNLPLSKTETTILDALHVPATSVMKNTQTIAGKKWTELWVSKKSAGNETMWKTIMIIEGATGKTYTFEYWPTSEDMYSVLATFESN